MVLDEHTALADASAARDAGADLVEFRIDEFFSGSTGADGQIDERELRTILRIVAESPLPCIVTCRAAAECGGVGGYDGDDMARVSLYERLGTASSRSMLHAAGGAQGLREHPPRYIDVEYATYLRSANIKQKINLAVDHPKQQRDVRTGLILSMHDFEGRPRDLLRRVSLMQSEPAASVVKVAITARSIRDNLELFDLLADGAAGRPMIALAMGRFGLMSRVLAPKFGGFLTFASLRGSGTTAPGQPTLRDLLDVYRFESITPRTQVFGLIGWPVEHSLSPLVHNAGFDALSPEEDSTAAHEAGFDGVYLPLPVPPEWEHFKATLASLIDHPRLDFSGCSVTVPHKQHLVRFAREQIAGPCDGVTWTIDELSRRCGAANTLTLRRDRGGRVLEAVVTNTDAAAAATCLRAALGSLAGARVAIIGAGGVARAIAAGLAAEGCAVSVHNRTREAADRLVEDLRRGEGEGDVGVLRAADMEDVYRQGFDAIVNATPVGMKGGPDPAGTAVDVERIIKEARAGAPVVFDTVYNPLQTPLLRDAARAGLRTIDGLGMFVEQAAAQFASWTGHAAPRGLFDRICREELEEHASA